MPWSDGFFLLLTLCLKCLSFLVENLLSDFLNNSLKKDIYTAKNIFITEFVYFLPDELLNMYELPLTGFLTSQVKFGQVSSGAQDDLEKVTSLAYAEITQYGMNRKFGSLSYSNQPMGTAKV